MALGTVTLYNGGKRLVVDTANRDWNDATAGSLMFCLASAAYTPAATHSTTSDVTGIITSGDGAPIAVVSPTLNDTTTPGTTYFDSDDANFGSNVTLTAKWLICVLPVTANTFSSSTSKLVWYVDLNNASGSATAGATAAPFVVIAPTNGWFKAS